MAKDKVIVIRGVLDWAKVMGPARPHTGEARYDKGPYWSVDVTPDDVDTLKKLGLSEKLRDPSEKDKQRVGRGPYLSLKVLENKKDGSKNNPPKVVDIHGNLWDEGLLGNGTKADVKVKVVDYGKGVQAGVYLQAIRVLDHVPYETQDFEPLSEEDEFFAAPEEQEVRNQRDVVADDEDEEDVPY